MAKKISINLDKWENALFPINTFDVDLYTCEILLYEKLTNEFGFTDKDIKQYLDKELPNMSHIVNYVEEKVILENGGIYYE